MKCHAEALERTLDKLDLDSREPWKPDPYRCSNAGKCTRYLAYLATPGFVPEPITSRGIRVFSLGQMLHETYQDMLQGLGMLKDVEKEISVEVPLLDEYKGSATKLSGHVDGVIEIEGKSYVFEFKTSSTQGFSMLQYAKLGPLEQMDVSYKDQHECYRRAYNLPGMFLYYNKDISALKAFSTPDALDEGAWSRVRSRYTNVARYLDSGSTEPPETFRDYQPVEETHYRKPTGRRVLPWQCAYCGARERCWPEATRDISKKKITYVV